MRLLLKNIKENCNKEEKQEEGNFYFTKNVFNNYIREIKDYLGIKNAKQFKYNLNFEMIIPFLKVKTTLILN